MCLSLLLYIPIFMPPPSWQIVEPKHPDVRIIFVADSTKPFRPSLNLVVEEVSLSEKEYLKAAKKVHLKEPDTTWRDLGCCPMKAGAGRLTEISYKGASGDVKLLQAIFLQKGYAYILTASALKEDFSALRQDFLRSMQSFSLPEDLLAAVPEGPKREKVSSLFDALKIHSLDTHPAIDRQKKLNRLEKEIVEDYTDLGSYWQLLALKEGISIIDHSNVAPSPKESTETK